MNLTTIQQKIYELRGEKVMLDFDLAELYEIEIKFLKRVVKRNISRFPWELKKLEKEIKSQFKDIYEALKYLLQKKQREEDFHKRERIGFKKGS